MLMSVSGYVCACGSGTKACLCQKDVSWIAYIEGGLLFPGLRILKSGCFLQDSILPPDVKARVSVEAASTFGWLKYVGFEGISLGVNQFGQSAPAPTIYEKLGITVDGVVKAAKSLL